MDMAIFLPILLAVVVFFIFFFMSNCMFGKKQPKNLPPTPPSSIPIIGHVHLLQQPLHCSLAALSTCYGSILHLRLGCRPILLVSSPSAAEDCLSKNDIFFTNRPRALTSKHLGYNYSTISSASYGPYWHNLRRIVTGDILSTFRVQILSDIRAKEIRSSAKALFKYSQTAKSVVELKSRLSELTFNVMMGMIADKRYYGEDVVALDEVKNFRRFVTQATELAGASNCGDFVPVLRWIVLGGVERRMIELARETDEYLQGLLDEKVQQGKEKDGVSSMADEEQATRTKKKTLMEVLVSLQETEPEYYTNHIIKGIIAVSG